MAKFDDEEREDDAPVERKRRRPRKPEPVDDEDGAPGPPGRKGGVDEGEEEEDSISTGNVLLDIILDFRDDCIDWAKGHVAAAASIIIGTLLLFFIVTGLSIRYYIRYINRPTLQTVLAAYDIGSYGEAKKLAEVVLQYAPETDLTARGGALYAMGASVCSMAEIAWNTDRRPYYLAAANYLREAEQYGFPPERRAQGYFLLGKSLYMSGELESCREPLLRALEYETENVKETYWYLCNSYFLAAAANPTEALRYLQLFRRDPLLTEEEKYESDLLQTLILLQLGRIDAAEQTFLKVPLFDRFETMRFFVSGQIAFFKARELRRQADELENSRNPIATGEIPIAPAPVSPQSESDPETYPEGNSDIQTELPDPWQRIPIALPPVVPSTEIQDSTPFTDPEAERLLPYSPESTRRSLSVESPDSFGPVLGPPDPPVTIRRSVVQPGVVCPAPIIQADYDASKPPLFRRMSWLIGRVEQQDEPNAETTDVFKTDVPEPSETEKKPPTDPDAVILLPKEPAVPETAPLPLPMPPAPGASSEQQVNPVLRRIERLREEADEKYREAIDFFLRVRQRDTFVPRWLRQAMLLEGLCYEETNDLNKARETYLSLSETYPGTSEAVAADFLWAEIERKFGQTETALKGYARAFDTIRAEKKYANPWLSQEEMLLRCENNIRNDLNLKEYQHALTLLYFLREVMPGENRARYRGEVYESWAIDLMRQSSVTLGSEGERFQRESWEKYRLAGESFEELARYELGKPDYDRQVWRSAENFREGRDFRRSIRLYSEYLRINWNDRQPETLLYLGEMYLHLDRLDDSIQSLERALESYPNHSLASRIRLVLSRAYYEKQNWDKAAQLLQANLLGEYAPSSSIYRDSMYALGKLYYEQGKTAEAIPYLEDAVMIHPNAIQSTDGHYCLSQAYLNRADDLLKTQDRTPLEGVKEAIRQDAKADRELALAHLRKTEELLIKRQNAIGLSRSEQLMLRNAVFGTGSVLMLLERYREAIPVFDIAATRYQDVPEGLDALMQIAVAYRFLGQPSEALSVLNRAEVVLNRLEKIGMIPPENEWASRIRVQKNLINLNK